jgi:TolB-like protein
LTYSRAARQYHLAAGIVDTITVQFTRVGDVAGVVRVTYSATEPMKEKSSCLGSEYILQ